MRSRARPRRRFTAIARSKPGRARGAKPRARPYLYMVRFLVPPCRRMVGTQAVLAQLHHQLGHALLAASGLQLGVQQRAAHFRQELFARARHAAPAIIFLDEIDALCPPRESVGPATARLCSLLLSLFDQLTERVVVIGATNR